MSWLVTGSASIRVDLRGGDEAEASMKPRFIVALPTPRARVGPYRSGLPKLWVRVWEGFRRGFSSEGLSEGSGEGLDMDGGLGFSCEGLGFSQVESDWQLRAPPLLTLGTSEDIVRS